MVGVVGLKTPTPNHKIVMGYDGMLTCAIFFGYLIFNDNSSEFHLSISSLSIPALREAPAKRRFGGFKRWPSFQRMAKRIRSRKLR
jgi:hypothetical protein